jgi:hypothetical protein
MNLETEQEMEPEMEIPDGNGDETDPGGTGDTGG